jgi:hypothetical protein
VFSPPRTSALGSLCSHLSREQEDFQPSNIVWSMFPPHEGTSKRLGKRDRHLALATRALEDLNAWLPRIGRTPMAATIDPESAQIALPLNGEPGVVDAIPENSDESDVMRPFVKVEASE